jgi:hypothetical protein
MTRLVLRLSLAIVLICGVGLLAAPGCAPGGGGGASVALVQGTADSALLDEVSKWATLETYGGNQPVGNYALVIVDADSTPAQQMDEELVIDEALDAGVPVLVLDASAEHKGAQALRELTAVSVGGDSYGYLIHKESMQGAQPHYRIVDLSWPSGAATVQTVYAGEAEDAIDTDETGSEGTSLADHLAATSETPPAWLLEQWGQEVRDFVEGDHSVQTRQSASGEYDPTQWTLSDRMKYRHSTIQTRTWRSLPKLTAAKSPDSRHAPDAIADTSATQLISSLENFTIYAFLCEYENSDDEYRIIVVQDGQFSPTQSGALYDNGKKLYYWYQVAFKTQLTPSQGDPQLLMSSPETAVGQSQVTDSTSTTVGTKWNVGGSLSADGLSISGGVEHWQEETIASAVTRTVNDWDLHQTSSFGDPLTVGWTYSMNTPYAGNSDTAAKPVAGTELTAGSKATMAFHTTSIWRVPKPASGPAPTVVFDLSRTHTADASFYYVFDIGIAHGNIPVVYRMDHVAYPSGSSPSAGGHGPNQLSVDLSKVPTLDKIVPAS